MALIFAAHNSIGLGYLILGLIALIAAGILLTALIWLALLPLIKLGQLSRSKPGLSVFAQMLAFCYAATVPIGLYCKTDSILLLLLFSIFAYLIGRCAFDPEGFFRKTSEGEHH